MGASLNNMADLANQRAVALKKVKADAKPDGGPSKKKQKQDAWKKKQADGKKAAAAAAAAAGATTQTSNPNTPAT